MAVAVAVRVRFFARLRELAGLETEPLNVQAGATLSDVYALLRGKHEALPKHEAVRAALNQEFADWPTVVHEGDEVAFIPPVSGGLFCVTT